MPGASESGHYDRRQFPAASGGPVFLKSLTLKGFKSFADTTVLDLEPGVTVVVGPNGSGKSNVVDAIGWVLGAQAPSTVRSQKMDDVIFAGTSKRAALGRAEVSLTIDNSAKLLPIAFAEVTLTRTLFRTGDSEYAINGVPCRLLDVQELLSDTGVGRQQHVIVSQGQIDAVLNARPEDRRLIIEEAAGVLKYRRRKEKAERRLAATEANLLRLGDLLREVRRQLRPLERQADAARRHGAVVEELGALRVHLTGRELARLRDRVGAGARRRDELAVGEKELTARLGDLDAGVLAAEGELSARGGDDLGDALVRFESLRERSRGLGAVLAERGRGIERDREAFVDRAVIASLEADAARLAAELASVEVEAAALVPDAARLAESETRLTADRASFDVERAEAGPEVAAGLAGVRTELGALSSGIERDSAEAARLRSRLGALDDKGVRLRADAGELRTLIRALEEDTAPGTERLRRVRADRAAVAQVAERAEEARREADADRHAWTARAEALASALDQARAQAGAAHLAEVDGVLGTVLDLVEVDAGWEAAFEAAAADALAAVVVDGVAAGRRALAALHDGEVSGAVLVLGAGGATVTPPAVGEPVRRHVRTSRLGAEALLDALVGQAVAVDGGWEEALDIALTNPDVVVVTRHGDRFGGTGWRLGGVGAGATGAARAEAEARAEAATRRAEAIGAEVVSARDALAAGQRAEQEAVRRTEADVNRRQSAAATLARIEADLEEAVTERAALHGPLEELEIRIARDRDRRHELETGLPLLESTEAEASARRQMAEDARGRLDERTAAIASVRRDLEVRAAGLEDRRQFLGHRLGEVDARLARSAGERHEAERRRSELDRRQRATERLFALVADRVVSVEAELDALRERRRLQSEAARAVALRLDGLRKERQAAERELAELRERAQRSELDDAEVRVRLESVTEMVRRELDCEPEAAIIAPCPPLANEVSAPARARELERDLRLMGPINPLALEEFEALRERHQFLADQLDDVKSSRRDLAKIIRAVDSEIVDVFARAYADVADNFTALFDTLFPGGRGRLQLTDPQNLLETGIEVEARPSGKNVRKLSLLSGGERSLTALAFLFAVFRSRPSPFYVMDEVEAALDDVNLHRFLDLVAEFRAGAQLMIVSHQKRTMEAADCLYGVTMAPGGSSRVVSEKVTT